MPYNWEEKRAMLDAFKRPAVVIEELIWEIQSCQHAIEQLKAQVDDTSFPASPTTIAPPTVGGRKTDPVIDQEDLEREFQRGLLAGMAAGRAKYTKLLADLKKFMEDLTLLPFDTWPEKTAWAMRVSALLLQLEKALDNTVRTTEEKNEGLEEFHGY